MVFGTAVTFRTHTKGHFSEVATSLYWAAKPSTGAAVAVPVATSSVLTLSAPSAVYGGDTVDAVVKVASASDVETLKGTVEILAGSTVVATATVNKFGNAKVALPNTLPVGISSLTATYSAEPGNALISSTSDAVELEVTEATTATEITLSAASQVFGQDPAATVDVVTSFVEGSAPLTGTVKLYSDDDEIASSAVSAGTVSFVFPKTLAEGAHDITAEFVPATGSPVAGSVSEASVLTVTPAPPVIPEKVTPTVAVTTSGAAFGKAAKATVSVTRGSDAATGSVAIEIDGSPYSVVQLAGGKATVTLSAALSAGKHTVTASFLGNETTKAGENSASVTIAKAKTTVSAKLNKSKAVRFSTTLKAAVVVKTPGITTPITGKVQVSYNGKIVKTVTVYASAKGKVTVTLPKFSKAGTNSVTVTYTGTDNLAKSTSSTYKVKVSKH
jgi:hypothetical protein